MKTMTRMLRAAGIVLAGGVLSLMAGCADQPEVPTQARWEVDLHLDPLQPAGRVGQKVGLQMRVTDTLGALLYSLPGKYELDRSFLIVKFVPAGKSGPSWTKRLRLDENVVCIKRGKDSASWGIDLLWAEYQPGQKNQRLLPSSAGTLEISAFLWSDYSYSKDPDSGLWVKHAKPVFAQTQKPLLVRVLEPLPAVAEN